MPITPIWSPGDGCASKTDGIGLSGRKALLGCGGWRGPVWYDSASADGESVGSRGIGPLPGVPKGLLPLGRDLAGCSGLLVGGRDAPPAAAAGDGRPLLPGMAPRGEDVARRGVLPLPIGCIEARACASKHRELCH